MNEGDAYGVEDDRWCAGRDGEEGRRMVESRTVEVAGRR